MRSLVVVFVTLVAASFAAPARAGDVVALSLTIAADDAVQRDIAATVVTAVRERWNLAKDSIDPGASCKAGDTGCLRILARSHGANYLLVVAVAPLGVRDHVLAVQLFDVLEGPAKFEGSAVQPGAEEHKTEVAKLTALLVKKLSETLTAKPVEAPAAPPTVVRSPGAMTFVGTGLVGAGVVAGGVTAIIAAVLASSHQQLDAGTAGAIGIGVSGGLVTVGAVFLAVDGT